MFGHTLAQGSGAGNGAAGGSSFSFSVAYQFTASQAKPIIISSPLAPKGEIADDSFSFSLIDAKGRRSVPAVFNISVQPALFALPSVKIPLAKQGGKIVVSVSAFKIIYN